jgi:hypothetical protein
MPIVGGFTQPFWVEVTNIKINPGQNDIPAAGSKYCTPQVAGCSFCVLLRNPEFIPDGISTQVSVK